MPILDLLKGAFAGKAADLTDSIFKGLDGLITNKEELAEAKLKAEQEINRHLEAIQTQSQVEVDSILKDKQSARDMYRVNSSLQKVYAITFLIAYVALSVVLIMVSVNRVTIPDYAIALISTIFGGMSTKVGTITDFLFGSSLGSKQKQDTLDSMKKDV